MEELNKTSSFIDPKASRIVTLGDGIADTAVGLLKTKFQIMVNTPLRCSMRAFEGMIKKNRKGGPKEGLRGFIEGASYGFRFSVLHIIRDMNEMDQGLLKIAAALKRDKQMSE